MVDVTRIEVTHFSDPCCPWAYSASPAHAVLRWRFGAQLDWRLRCIGLTEEAEQYVARGYTPTRSALGFRRFRRFGMPFGGQPRERVTATGRACRAVVATRLLDPLLAAVGLQLILARPAVPPRARSARRRMSRLSTVYLVGAVALCAWGAPLILSDLSLLARRTRSKLEQSAATVEDALKE